MPNSYMDLVMGTQHLYTQVYRHKQNNFKKYNLKLRFTSDVPTRTCINTTVPVIYNIGNVNVSRVLHVFGELEIEIGKVYPD